MPEQEKKAGGLSIQTLLVSALAAVTSATVVPLFWQAGTVLATAMTPVVVAIASELFRKPVQHVSAVAPRVARRSGTGAAVRRFDPDAARTREHASVGARGRGPERFEPLPEHLRGNAPAPRDDDPFGLRKAARNPRPRLKLALITGVLAFALAAAVVTASELTIFGGSVSGKRGSTTLFSGGGSSSTKRRDATPTPTATPAGQATPAPSAAPTETPGATATPTPGASATPSPAPSSSPAPTPTP